jgi:16S rRNA (uracil1498-N3)-methyltransferase
MELFYAYEADGRTCRLDAEESTHCVRVLRHRTGDEIDVIDGLGTLYRCRLTDDSPKGAEAAVLPKKKTGTRTPTGSLSAAVPPRTMTASNGLSKRPPNWV